MLPKVFGEIVNGIWAIEKSYADSYIPVIANIIEGKTNFNAHQKGLSFAEENIQKENIRYLYEDAGIYKTSEYGDSAAPENAPRNSIAIINIVDAITKYDTDCGPAGAQTKSEILQRADANSDIKGIILNIDSPGGEGYAAINLSDTIKKLETPVIAFINDIAASAAYMIASATDYVVANTEMAKIGSIGTYVTLADYTEFYKLRGIRLVDVYADKSSDKNKAYKSALEGDLSLLKKDVNKFNEKFLQEVRQNRASLNTDENTWGTGKLFSADEAFTLGLIDDIASWEDTVQSFVKSLNL